MQTANFELATRSRLSAWKFLLPAGSTGLTSQQSKKHTQRNLKLLLLPCVLHFIFIEQDRPRPRAPCPEHAFSCPIERQKRHTCSVVHVTQHGVAYAFLAEEPHHLLKHRLVEDNAEVMVALLKGMECIGDLIVDGDCV